MRLKCYILLGTERVACDTVVQLKCDARVQSEKQGILGIEVVEIFSRVSHLAELTTLLPRSTPNGSHDRHLMEHKSKVCQLVTVRHTVVVSAVGRVREPPASATNVPVHEIHPADAAHVQMTEKAIPRRAPLSLQPLALGLSVQGARADVMCGHRLTKICWQRLAGHCVALLMFRQCRQLNLGAEAC